MKLQKVEKKALFLYKGKIPLKGEAPVQMEITETEAMELVNEIHHQPNRLF